MHFQYAHIVSSAFGPSDGMDRDNVVVVDVVHGDIEDDDDKEDAGVRTDGGENAATAPSSRLVLVHRKMCSMCFRVSS